MTEPDPEAIRKKMHQEAVARLDAALAACADEMRDTPEDPDDYDDAVVLQVNGPPNVQQAVIFYIMDNLRRGWLPGQEWAAESDWQALRRMGYLMMVVAAFGKPENWAALRILAADYRRKARSGCGHRFPIENVIPGGPVSTLKQMDDLATRWGYNPGVDIDRWLFERG